MTIIKIRLGSDKTENWNQVLEQTNDEWLAEQLKYALDDVEFTLYVDENTGRYRILEVKEKR